MLPIQSDPPTKGPQTEHPYLAVLGLPAGEAVRLTLHRYVLVTGQRAVTLVAAEVLQVPESLLRACPGQMNNFSFIEIHIEFKFLDIKLTKDSSRLLHAIHSPFYWRILKRPYSSLVLKSLLKHAQNKKTRV